MTGTRSKTARTSGGKRLSVAKKTLRNLSARDTSVRGGRIGVYLPTDSCVIKLGCPKG